jgi:hypothetical protein
MLARVYDDWDHTADLLLFACSFSDGKPHGACRIADENFAVLLKYRSPFVYPEAYDFPCIFRFRKQDLLASNRSWIGHFGDIQIGVPLYVRVLLRPNQIPYASMLEGSKYFFSSLTASTNGSRI